MVTKSIREIYSELDVPQNIIHHMEAVWEVAKGIAENLVQRGEKINLEALKRACLLHDICKINKGADHANSAYKYLIQLNENEIAVIIKKHEFDCILAENLADRPQSLEEKILYYADKRVLHDKVVSIEERLEDGIQRYFNGIPPENEKAYLKSIKELERELLVKD